MLLGPQTGVQAAFCLEQMHVICMQGVNYTQIPPVCGYVVKTIFDIDQMTVAETPIFYLISIKLKKQIP